MIPILGVPIVNGFHWLDRLIKSIDFPIDQLIILNNNSDDIELVNSLNLLADHKYSYINKIKVCHLPANIGVAASWNLIIKSNINAPYWLISNHDIGFTPGLLKNFFDTAQNNDIGIVYGSGGDFGDGGYDIFLIKDWVIQKIGLFDENFYPAYCEDADYIMRLFNYNVTNDKIITKPLDILYFHGNGLSSDKNCYLEHGQQSSRHNDAIQEKIAYAHYANFEYMNKKWGNDWRVTSPQKFPLNIDNMPLTYTSYDLNFCRSKYIDFKP
jgi:GT2 family glycosyltransferase